MIRVDRTRLELTREGLGEAWGDDELDAPGEVKKDDFTS